MKLKDVKKVSVVGAGLMGHGIAQAFAQKGYPVSVYDINKDILDQALINIRYNLGAFVEAGLEDESRLPQILSLLSLTTELDNAVGNADIVIEAAPEDLDLKKELFKDIDRYSPDHTILASNTSMLPISEFGSQVAKKEKLIITHWFNPPHIVPVVEIVSGDCTSKDTFDTTFRLLCEIGKQPVRVLKELPGFLVNRIQTAMFREVLSLLEKNVASAEDIDKAVKGSFGFRLGVIGILETMDMAGLDLMYKAAKHLYKFIDNSTKPQSVLKDKVDEGKLGIKTGGGFFLYEREGALGQGKVKTKNRDMKLLEFLKVVRSS